MRKWAAFMVWSCAGLSGTSFGSLGCGFGRACTLIGCIDNEQLAFSVATAQVAETDVSACRNERCWHVRLAASDLTTITSHRSFRLQSDDGTNGFAGCDLDIDTPLPAGHAELRFVWGVSSSDSPAMAGDLLKATFSDSSGSVVLSESATVSSFEHFYPNGKDCGDGCRTASVTGSVD